MNKPHTPSDKPVILGKIGKTHGIKGWLKLHSFTEHPEAILNYPRFQTELQGQQKELEPDDSQLQGSNIIIHFKGFDDPETARTLTGLELAVSNTALPQLEGGMYYWHQLQGLRVVNQHGESFGTVKRLLETGANDVLLVQPDDNSVDSKERLIPWVPDSIVSEVDLNARLLKVNWEADYLA
ncbi:MAG: ribosome maturation factor RimM [Pseudohongiellaceae bacterium]